MQCVKQRILTVSALTDRQRTDHPVRLTSESLSQRTGQLSSSGFIYQLLHKEPLQRTLCLKPEVRTQRGSLACLQWGPCMTTLEEISAEMFTMRKKCCLVRQDDGLRHRKQTLRGDRVCLRSSTISDEECN